jgi:hypothetical protein
VSADLWPPVEKERPGDHHDARPNHQQSGITTTTNQGQNNRPGRRDGDTTPIDTQTLHDQLHRRRLAGARSLPLLCGCRCRDPWRCRCGPPVQLTDHQLDGWRHAIAHLAAHDQTPIVSAAVRAALRNREAAA